jgi:ribonuclease-3
MSHRSTLRNVSMKSRNLKDFAKSLGFKGRFTAGKLSLFVQALTHSSWVNENPDESEADNENLEFLGDAVLDLIVSNYIYRSSPDLSPGLYTRLRANVVNRNVLARKAREIGIGPSIRLGKGEELTSGRDKDSVLANALEAVIGAQFLAAGYQAADKMVLRMFKSEIDAECRRGGGDDHKSLLQNLTQDKFKEVPRYRVAKSSGPDHDRLFEIEALIQGQVMGHGSGKSKKIAEQDAARAAIERLARAGGPEDTTRDTR